MSPKQFYKKWQENQLNIRCAGALRIEKLARVVLTTSLPGPVRLKCKMDVMRQPMK